MGIGFSGTKASWSYSGFSHFRRRLIPDGQNDPIRIFLGHSDCDGELSPDECALIAPRIRYLIKDWDREDYDRKNATELADAMEECVIDNKPLIFY